MRRVLAIAVLAVLLFAGAVWFAIRPDATPRGYSGLQFAPLTAAAALRMPGLAKAALVTAVDDDSPADKAGVLPGMVVVAIDDVATTSARQASDRVRDYRAGQKAVLTLYDPDHEAMTPQKVPIVFAELPDPALTKKYSVLPPRTLAKEVFYKPTMAANSDWSRRILRGPTIRPLTLDGLGAGRCNGFAPEHWKVAGHATDDSMFHVMSTEGFQHALYLSTPLGGQAPRDAVRQTLEATFGAPAVLTPDQARPFGFQQVDFGNNHGGAGFVIWRVQGARIQMWIAAVAAAEASWAEPLAGATALSLNCAPGKAPRDPALAATAISLSCQDGKCQDSDFAATVMASLKLGYVHDMTGHTYLVNPKRDYWIDGADGPGFYHQIGGENEKLEPGRTN